MQSNPPTEPYHYADHIVAFLDLVAFEDRVLHSEPDQISQIVTALSNAHGWLLRKFQRDVPETKIHLFSDTMVISCPHTDPSTLSVLLAGISNLQCNMTTYDQLIRGYVTIGSHYQSETIIFGPAMIEAYHGEQRATWPHILVKSGLHHTMAQYNKTHNTPTFFRRDKDGIYVDYLTQGSLMGTLHWWVRQYAGETIPTPDTPYCCQLLNDHKQAITSYCSKAKPEHAPSLRTLACYHNQTVTRLARSFASAAQPNTLDPSHDVNYLLHRTRAAIATSVQPPPAPQQVSQFLMGKLSHLPEIIPDLHKLCIDTSTILPRASNTTA